MLPPVDHKSGHFESIAIGLLVVVTLVALLSWQLRIPYNLALVLTGLALTFILLGARLTVSPDSILDVFAPPLAFSL